MDRRRRAVRRERLGLLAATAGQVVRGHRRRPRLDRVLACTGGLRRDPGAAAAGHHRDPVAQPGLLRRLGSDLDPSRLVGELTVAGLVPLVERGVFTGRNSALHPGRFVATLIGNTPAERAVVHGNPGFEAYSTEYLLDPRTIARNEGIVAINGALGIDLSGQTAFVTGGTRGIGRAVVTALHAAGARVAVVGRDADKARAVATELGERALGVAADVGAFPAVEQAIAENRG